MFAIVFVTEVGTFHIEFFVSGIYVCVVFVGAHAPSVGIAGSSRVHRLTLPCTAHAQHTSLCGYLFEPFRGSGQHVPTPHVARNKKGGVS